MPGSGDPGPGRGCALSRPGGLSGLAHFPATGMRHHDARDYSQIKPETEDLHRSLCLQLVAAALASGGLRGASAPQPPASKYLFACMVRHVFEIKRRHGLSARFSARDPHAENRVNNLLIAASANREGRSPLRAGVSAGPGVSRLSGRLVTDCGLKADPSGSTGREDYRERRAAPGSGGTCRGMDGGPIAAGFSTIIG